MGLNELLNHHKFSAHPFETWIAEDEKNLEEWFIPPPFIDVLIGKTKESKTENLPRSNLIFGRPGSGKTAIRRMLERELLSYEGVLVLRYTNFAKVIKSSPCPDLDAHLDEIFLLATIGLMGLWQKDKNVYLKLKSVEKAELAGLIYKYYDVLPPLIKEAYICNLNPLVGNVTRIARAGKKTLIDFYNTTISILKKDKITPSDWGTNTDSSMGTSNINPILGLHRLWSLASKMGIKSIWILLDGIDEGPIQNGAEGIFKAISNLLLSLPVMEYRQEYHQLICFKVFLTRPKEIKELLKENDFRFDRLKTVEISWQNKDLSNCLLKRLAYFSNNHILDFDKICVPEAKGTHSRLVEEANLRPRTLFRMANEILTEFQKNADPNALFIDLGSIEKGIAAGKDSVVSFE